MDERKVLCGAVVLNSNRMQGDEFSLESPGMAPSDGAWPSALLFETPEQIYQRVYRVLRPRSAPPAVEVRFEKFVNADSRIRFQNGALLVRVTDMLESAPSPVHESLAYILLSKLLRKQIPKVHAHRYRLFLNRRDMRKRALAVRQERGTQAARPSRRARVYNLETIFEELNGKVFSRTDGAAGAGMEFAALAVAIGALRSQS